MANNIIKDKSSSALGIGIIALVSVSIQLYLMIENSLVSLPETIIRFFSFFTILTNLMVGVYFTAHYFSKNKIKLVIQKPEVLTAITVYITIVGLVYQIALRQVWEPKGLQKIIDELLHSIIPVLVIVYWYFYKNKNALHYKSAIQWLIYPLVYLVYILVRGSFSNFYPYPFVNVTTLGFEKVMVNSAILVLVFLFVALLFVKMGRVINK